MAENSSIEWCDHTFNGWIGCSRVGPGCDNCYAAVSTPVRVAGIKWGPGEDRVRTKPSNWAKPRQWERNAESFMAQHGRRQRVFCSSLADVFDNEVPTQWRTDLLRLILETPSLDWLLLTKRIGNARRMLDDAVTVDGRLMDASDRYRPLPNVWIGATVVNQDEADRDIPKLLEVPAAIRFLSIEPMLGAIDLSRFLWQCCGNYQDGAEHMGSREGPVCCGNPETKDLLHWIIVGGESGPKARPAHPNWFRSLRDQCAQAEVPYLFKQWGEWAPHRAGAGGDEGGDLRRGHVRYLEGDGRRPDGHFRKGDAAVARIGKKASGRLIDGIEHNGFPQSFHN
jgi:protein gp37